MATAGEDGFHGVLASQVQKLQQALEEQHNNEVGGLRRQVARLEECLQKQLSMQAAAKRTCRPPSEPAPCLGTASTGLEAEPDELLLCQPALIPLPNALGTLSHTLCQPEEHQLDTADAEEEQDLQSELLSPLAEPRKYTSRQEHESCWKRPSEVPSTGCTSSLARYRQHNSIFSSMRYDKLGTSLSTGSADTDGVAFAVLPRWTDSTWRRNRRAVRSHSTRKMSINSGNGGAEEMKSLSLQSVMPVEDCRNRSSAATASGVDVAHACSGVTSRLSWMSGQPQPLRAWGAERQRWMIPPNSSRNIARAALGFVLLLYETVVIPLDLFGIVDIPTTAAMAWVIRLWWTLDILLTFCTGRLNKQGVVQMRPEQVAKKYLKTWLPFDFFMVGLDWLLLLLSQAQHGSSSGSRGGAHASWSRGLLALRALKALRLCKAPEIEGFLQEHIRSEQVHLVADIAKSIAMLLYVAHLIACGWYAVGRSGAGGEQGWVELNLAGSEGREGDIAAAYLWSFHWALGHFAGELLYDPVTLVERTFAVVVLCGTFLISCLFLSGITTAFTRLSILASTQSSQLSTLRRFLSDNSISASLAVRIQRNAQLALCEQKRNIPENDIQVLKLVSEPLRAELHLERFAPLLMRQPFMGVYHLINPSGILKICHEAVSLLSLSERDLVFADMEIAEQPRMFFVRTGSFFYGQDESPLKPVEPGQWVSEASLWTRWMHVGTLEAATESTLLALDSAKFQQLVSPFPTSHAQSYAAAFVRLLNDSERGKLSDLPLTEEQVQLVLSEAFPAELVGRWAASRRSESELTSAASRAAWPWRWVSASLRTQSEA